MSDNENQYSVPLIRPGKDDTYSFTNNDARNESITSSNHLSVQASVAFGAPSPKFDADKEQPASSRGTQKKKMNFKHGANPAPQDQQQTGYRHPDNSLAKGSSSQGQQTQSNGTKSQSRGTVMTQETIEVQIDRQAIEARGGDAAIKKIAQARKNELRLREAHQKCAALIENDEDIQLLSYLQQNKGLMVNEMIDSNGKTLLHECTFNDAGKCIKVLLDAARSQNLTQQQLAAWVNVKDSGDGFTALHFASFKGNPDVCELLIDSGADIHAKNNFGINMLHVAAQGDQPISIYFFKLRGLDLRSRDNRGSTPLHWAAYSKAEITLVYLLSWVDFLDDQDCDGFTPLHLAVKSVESLKSTRPVRSLLIRGASRDVVDNQDRKPIDLAEFVTTPQLRANLASDLAEPSDMQCLMLKTPLKLVTKSMKTPFVMWFLMLLVYKFELLYLMPLYYDQLALIYTQLSLFGLTVFIHILCLCKDPGYLKSPKGVPFMEMMKIFDPVLLCADCEVVRTDRSRHCSICNRCVERFDHHCPWINNCVGLNNHGIFMSFLLSMFSLLVVTFISLVKNFDCWENKDKPRDDKFLYENLFMPDWTYDRIFVETAILVCLTIVSMFLFLVALLTIVQLRNFCLNKTTSERFAKAKVVQESRTSTYLESQGGQSFMSEDDLGSSIVEAMQTRDHSHRTCTCLHNCFDMWCMSEHPDQAKIYMIQSGKSMKMSDEQQQLLFEQERDVDGKKSQYNKTPKPRKHSQSQVGIEGEETTSIIEEESALSINSDQKGHSNYSRISGPQKGIETRHSLNNDRDDRDDGED